MSCILGMMYQRWVQQIATAITITKIPQRRVAILAWCKGILIISMMLIMTITLRRLVVWVHGQLLQDKVSVIRINHINIVVIIIITMTKTDTMIIVIFHRISNLHHNKPKINHNIVNVPKKNNNSYKLIIQLITYFSFIIVICFYNIYIFFYTITHAYHLFPSS